MKRAIFLDRDGVIIENRPDYVRSWDDVAFYPQALTGLAQICQLPYLIVLITNQSAVGREIISLDTAWTINRQLVDVVNQNGGRIDRVYMCPHAPWEGCNCRKPKPGLLLQAASELSIDLDRSLMIGDALTDLQAAAAAGVSRTALVRTGRGAEQERLPEAQNLQPLSVYPELSGALRALLHL
jgi:D-glycero-D-manno-heptose 1,7-bisphosphate phosphatase